MLHVATCLWDANEHTDVYSGTYTEAWVEKLYRGAQRNLTRPFRFVVFVDRPREFSSPDIHQEPLSTDRPSYGNFTEPYRLGEPMILVGLDTVFVGNIDHLADWCRDGDKIALPRAPQRRGKPPPTISINGVALVPRGWRRVYEEWHGENDMEHLRRYPYEPIQDRWPGQVLSYKLNVRMHGDEWPLPKECRIVYFHGQPKLDSLTRLPWVRAHWR